MFSRPTIGCWIDGRIKGRLAADTLSDAVTRRGEDAGCAIYSDSYSPFQSRRQGRNRNISFAVLGKNHRQGVMLVMQASRIMDSSEPARHHKRRRVTFGRWPRLDARRCRQPWPPWTRDKNRSLNLFQSCAALDTGPGIIGRCRITISCHLRLASPTQTTFSNRA